jgi:hypothetical protein
MKIEKMIIMKKIKKKMTTFMMKIIKISLKMVKMMKK